MPKFTKVLKVSPHRDGINWILIDEFWFNYEKESKIIKVPVGFITDFASVPWFLRWICSTWGKYGYAAIIHDWLYWEQERADVTKNLADDIFFEGMCVSKVNPVFKHVFYFTVKYFGYLAWLQNQIDRQENYRRVNTLEIDSFEIKDRPSRQYKLVAKYEAKRVKALGENIKIQLIKLKTSFSSSR